MRDFDSNNHILLAMATKAFLCEPVYTEDEVLQLKSQKEREKRETVVETEEQDRSKSKHCETVSTSQEAYHCLEWSLVTTLLGPLGSAF